VKRRVRTTRAQPHRRVRRSLVTAKLRPINYRLQCFRPIVFELLHGKKPKRTRCSDHLHIFPTPNVGLYLVNRVVQPLLPLWRMCDRRILHFRELHRLFRPRIVVGVIFLTRNACHTLAPVI